VSLAELERFVEAANALETAVFHHPDDGTAWGRLGQAYTETGRHREAMPAYERAVELGFTPPGVWANMGRSAAEVRDLRALGRAYQHLRGPYPADAEVLKGKLVELHRERRLRRRRRTRARGGGEDGRGAWALGPERRKAATREGGPATAG
jgi:tetratricopeptide (TPR) repeat protein